MAMENCKCKVLRCVSYNKKKANYQCRCGKSKFDLPMTQAMREEVGLGRRVEQKHKLVRAFNRAFGKAEAKRGWTLMEAIGKFAAKNPDVICAGVDDAYFASSDLWFVPHEDEHEFWGITVWYIPQCTGEEPIQFFLYPGHLFGLLDVCKHFEKKIRGKKRRAECDYEIPPRLSKKEIAEMN